MYGWVPTPGQPVPRFAALGFGQSGPEAVPLGMYTYFHMAITQPLLAVVMCLDRHNSTVLSTDDCDLSFGPSVGVTSTQRKEGV